jgi:cellulose synthase/poly-beta-1,6-N-acetylglucosamine synthase-like glycosyltransferase
LEKHDSILQQDFAAFELIIVDDGSTDNTEEVVTNIKIHVFAISKKKMAKEEQQGIMECGRLRVLCIVSSILMTGCMLII